MEASDIKPIVEQALRDPQNFPLRVYVIICLVTGVSAFFGAYCIRLGQVFAERKQSERLQELAQANQKVIELMSQKHQLRLAALDRRLEVHQLAYALWIKLMSAMHTNELDGVVIECQNWWYNNCLYLDAKAREAFYRAFRAASNHEILLRNLVNGGTTREEIERNGDVIRAAGHIIEQAVELPPIKDFREKAFREGQ
jgi:hypothetical protein